jgi:hypothetical protein
MAEFPYQQRIIRIVNKNGDVVKDVHQFRTKTEHLESPTTTPVPKGWTEWQDVPVKVDEVSDVKADK